MPSRRKVWGGGEGAVSPRKGTCASKTVIENLNIPEMEEGVINCLPRKETRGEEKARKDVVEKSPADRESKKQQLIGRKYEQDTMAKRKRSLSSVSRVNASGKVIYQRKKGGR